MPANKKRKANFSFGWNLNEKQNLWTERWWKTYHFRQYLWMKKEKKTGVFENQGKSLNNNCNLPFERGEIFLTTNYLPICLCIGVSHSLIGSDPLPHCIWRSKSRMNAERTGAGCERAGEFSWTLWCSETCRSDLFRTMLHLSAHVIM